MVGDDCNQFRVARLGSGRPERKPDFSEELTDVSSEAIVELIVPGSAELKLCAAFRAFTVRVTPSDPVYWKLPNWACGWSTVWDVLMVPGDLDMLKLPKKNSLFLRIGPPDAPAKIVEDEGRPSDTLAVVGP